MLAMTKCECKDEDSGMGTHTHPPSELSLIWYMITAALAMNVGSWRNHGHVWVFFSSFLLAVSNKSLFCNFWAVFEFIHSCYIIYYLFL